MLTILDGKKLSRQKAESLKRRIMAGKITPVLAIVQIGSLPESNIYIKHKKKFAEEIGASVLHVELDQDVSENSVINKLTELNNDQGVHGIILQLPIPKHLNKRTLIETIAPNKDVDGLHSVNQAKIFQGDDSGIIPATPKGILSLLTENNITLSGKRVLVIGRSLLVGRPLAMLLLNQNATVTIAHSKTNDLCNIAKESDIVIAAVGHAGLVTRGFVREGQVIVDVGTNSIVGPKTLEETDTRKLVGDVVFDDVKGIVYAISPVPGGVGPMTVASLFENLVSTINL